MTIVSILALIVMMSTAGGLVHEFYQFKKDSEKTQAKFDQALVKGDALLAKLDQLVALLTAMNTPSAAPPPRKKATRRRRATATPDPATTEPKGGSDDDKKTSPVIS